MVWHECLRGDGGSGAGRTVWKPELCVACQRVHLGQCVSGVGLRFGQRLRCSWSRPRVRHNLCGFPGGAVCPARPRPTDNSPNGQA